MKLVKRVTATFVSSMLLAMLCFTSSRAQDIDESSVDVPEHTPQVAQVAGTWTGTDTQDGGSPGAAMLLLTQSGKIIGGTFSLSTDGDTPTGPVTGKISKDDLKLTFHATSGTNHPCTANVLATVDPDAMPPTMEGTFLVKGGKHCKGKGTFDLTLQ
ncbi:MAG: hypothetical protein WAU82_16195 [Candidatus Binatus sp.]|uniref:hypothetical protein n=1 Tax=Candidatus Binatus sp. TaxID=2811406 RepID=UPI003BB1710D